MGRALIILSLILVAGCNHGNLRGGGSIGDRLESWKGKSIDEAISEFGVPEREFTKTDGSKVYAFSETHPAGGLIRKRYEGHCNFDLTADPKGIIIKWHFQGACN